ncbi:MAG: VWA domain-containing protein [Candidatus Eremiobacteraeota bacterium]|nr:VWA domain-containing protein [Candidatus Eremiobacteraeota bacterium]
MTFSENVAAFTAALRDEHGFGAGHAATRDALRAADILGVTEARRLRSAFRAVYCATPEEVARFDAAFDAFFRAPRGVAQPHLRPRHTRPDPAQRPRDEIVRTTERPSPAEMNDAAVTWQTLRARYSARAARGEPPRIQTDGLEEIVAAAARIVAGVRIARSRRRTPRRSGSRIDLRRTLRASVETAGEPVDLRRTARTLRGARFVVLIDGSRSAAEFAGPVLQLAYALVQRSRRANAFVFSTALREVTRALRDRSIAGAVLSDLGEAWGGGTRIGDNLAAFVRDDGGRLLSPETIVLIFSDGLDVGDLDRLARAMRELQLRSAAVIWLNPHAGSPGFTPTARGMQTALPFVTQLRAARAAHDFTALARALTRTTTRGR